MALDINKTVKLSGFSTVNGQAVVSLIADCYQDSSLNMVNQTIQDLELYNANKVQCRRDISEFQNMVYEIEDQMYTENASGGE